jgi:hypothetical protein
VRVADRIVGLAVRPRRSVRVGSLNALAVPYRVAPDVVPRLAARLGRRYLLRSGPPAPPDPGGLLGPVAGPAHTRGGWGREQRRTARLLMASAAAAGLAVGVSWRRSAAGGLLPGD